MKQSKIEPEQMIITFDTPVLYPPEHPGAVEMNKTLVNGYHKKVERAKIEITDILKAFKPIEDTDAAKTLHEKAERFKKRWQAYESKIEEKLKDQKPTYCKDHDTLLEIDRDETIIMSRKEGKLTLVYNKCPACVQLKKDEAWLQHGVPLDTIHATFDNYETPILGQQRALDKIKEASIAETQFIIACGTPGTGKTHLLTAWLKERKGTMVTHSALVDELRETYQRGNKRSVVYKYREPIRLVVDEISSKIKGDDIEPFMYEILAYRYDRNLETAFGSNEDLDGVLKTLSERLVDRIGSNYVVANFSWDSYRRN